MKGPGFRHDLDVRRVWHCPQCHRQRKLPGELTTVACVCGQPMRLAGEWRSRFNLPRAVTPLEIPVASFGLTEEELVRPGSARPPRPPTPPASSGLMSSAPRPRPARVSPPLTESPEEPQVHSTLDDADLRPTEAEEVTDFGAGLMDDAEPRTPADPPEDSLP